jgi:ABC-type dipeptide/oligopeptide/nickel transport system permease component
MLLRYILRRLWMAVFVMACTVVITFVIARVIPADPARLYAGGLRATPAAIHQATIELGLNKPLVVQFWNYVDNLAHLNFGQSIVTLRPVATDIANFLPNTLELIIPAMTLALVVGVPVGVLAGSRPGSKIDRISRYVALGGAAIAPFWLALVAQLILSVELGWLPVGGQLSTAVSVFDPVRTITHFLTLDALLSGNWYAFGDSLRYLIMPVAVLTVYPLCLVIRQTRASVFNVMGELYVTAARSQGFSERSVRFRWVLRNAIIPTLTVAGLALAGSLTGAVLVEVLFSWPGIGRYITSAIQAGDYSAVMAVVIIGTLGYVFINLLVDILQASLDPRVRAD